jgi:hypothetical protein
MLLSTLCLCLVSPAGATAIGMDGRAHRPIEEAKGKPLALIFVSHDCPVCNAYSPEISRLEKAFQGKARISLVYSEPNVTSQVAKTHAKEYSLSRVPFLLDASRTFAQACGAKMTPEAIVFDDLGRKVYQGRIDNRFRSIGSAQIKPSQLDLQNALNATLRHAKPKPAGGAPVGCYILQPGIS